MRFSALSSAAVLIAGLAISAATADCGEAAPRKAVPLPDPNPARAATPQQPAASRQPAKLAPLPERNPRIGQEVAFFARAALKPLVDFELGRPDRDRLRAAISAVYKGRFPAALATIERLQDKNARKLALWYYYRSHGVHADGAEIEAFRVANPEWPDQDRLRRNAEFSLFLNSAKPDAITAFFAASAPQTGAGKAALASAYLTTDKARAEALVREAWRNHTLTERIEEEIAKRFPDMLTEADHKARVDRLLYQDRKSRIPAVLRTAKLLPEAEQKKIDARVEVVRRSKKAKKLLKGIPEQTAKDDLGLYFSRIQWLRRHEREEDAWNMLRMVPNEPAQLIDLGEWWIERRVNCRSALNAGHPQIAYEIASDHGPLTGEYYGEAEFLAGWIALRFLDKPDLAQKHFLALRTSALAPERLARAEYWLGRTADALGRSEETATHFAHAAAHPLTYYGQLARQALDPTPDILEIEPAPMPTQADVERFLARDAVRAIAILRTSDLGNLGDMFFHQLARTLTAPGEIVLLAELAQLFDQPYASVRLGKIALNRGLPSADYAFPVGLLPDYKQLNGEVETAFLYAISRQESEFNPEARSPVGARGLMQLMPGTARAVARQFRVRYRKSKLTKDPSYNMMLGAAHLSDLIDGYNGSYILALVAYNAGPGRVEEWTSQFGDPRDPEVDAIDWVERIPFTETREYVQKILTTVQIFRARIEGPDAALRLVQDLNRNTAAKAELQIIEAAATD